MHGFAWVSVLPGPGSARDLPGNSCPAFRPPQASLVIKGPSVSLEGVDLIGWGCPGLTWEESHGLVRTVHDGRAVMT